MKIARLFGRRALVAVGAVVLLTISTASVCGDLTSPRMTQEDDGKDAPEPDQPLKTGSVIGFENQLGILT